MSDPTTPASATNAKLPHRGLAAILVLASVGSALWSGIPAEAAKYPRGTTTESALAAVSLSIGNQDGSALDTAMTTIHRLEQDGRAVPLLVSRRYPGEERF